MTSVVAELAALELARNGSEMHEHKRCGQTADENTVHRRGGTSKEEIEISEADMTPGTHCKIDAMDDRKAETHSQPVAADAAPMEVTDTDTEFSSDEDGDIIRVRASDAPPGSIRENKSCAVIREDSYLRNTPTTSKNKPTPTEGENAGI
eukprot:6179477-Pleurochrysis_carterae.AAC.1